MKGKLKHKEGKWFVQYLEAQDAKYMCSQMTDIKEFPLHPDSLLSPLTINNGLYGIEKEVEFEIIDIVELKCCYAKLIQPKMSKESLGKEASAYYKDEPEEETWDDIFAKVASESDVSDAVTPGGAFFKIKKYLSQNYHSPKKK